MSHCFQRENYFLAAWQSLGASFKYLCIVSSAPFDPHASPSPSPPAAKKKRGCRGELTEAWFPRHVHLTSFCCNYCLHSKSIRPPCFSIALSTITPSSDDATVTMYAAMRILGCDMRLRRIMTQSFFGAPTSCIDQGFGSPGRKVVSASRFWSHRAA